MRRPTTLTDETTPAGDEGPEYVVTPTLRAFGELVTRVEQLEANSPRDRQTTTTRTDDALTQARLTRHRGEIEQIKRDAQQPHRVPRHVRRAAARRDPRSARRRARPRRRPPTGVTPVTHVPASAIADQAVRHLGEPGPLDTCVSNGLNRWPGELGLPVLGTSSVTEAVRLAKAGHNGYRYVDGTAGMARGHFGIWSHQALGSVNDEHTCVVDHVDGNLWRGIGSGTPSGKVARQPASGGLNPKSVLVGYIVAPTETVAAAGHTAPAKPATAAAAAGATGTYTVQRRDTLTRIAAKHHTTVPAILKANPPAAGGKSADFHIARANLILVGQRIRIP
jgi:hypothetical protein